MKLRHPEDGLPQVSDGRNTYSWRKYTHGNERQGKESKGQEVHPLHSVPLLKSNDIAGQVNEILELPLEDLQAMLLVSELRLQLRHSQTKFFRGFTSAGELSLHQGSQVGAHGVANVDGLCDIDDDAYPLSMEVFDFI